MLVKGATGSRNVVLVAVMAGMDRVLSAPGVPEMIRPNNGPCLNSERISDLFAKYPGFTHSRVTLRWPRANGEAGRIMQSLEEIFKICRLILTTIIRIRFVQFPTCYSQDSKVHGGNIGPIWGRQDPDGPHVGPMNFAVWVHTLRQGGHLLYLSAIVKSVFRFLG